mgnify:CR=1 FL=1
MTNPSIPSPQSEGLPGLNIMIIGASGVGKTYSIHDIVDYGFETFCLMTESGLESLLGYWTDRNLPIPANLHWHQVRATNLGFKEMISSAKDVNQLTFEMLLKKPDTNKGKFTAFIDLLTALSDFKDDRTGQSFGAVDDWGPDRWLCLDSLTGINTFAMQNTIGGKSVRDQKDWSMAQVQVENLLRMLADGCKCHFLLLGHTEREVDPVNGGVKIMASTLGKALAPKLPAMFSEVILAEKAGDKWQWVTNSPMADTKSRYLSTGIHPQSFKPLIEKWISRGGKFTPPISS